MIRQRLIAMTLLILILSLQGCDPFYSISITNKTNDTANILIKPTASFRTEKSKSQTTSDGFDIYELYPNEKIKVGSAIAEIDDDIPFEIIKIIQKGDTTMADNLEEIKSLFDKKFFGRLKTPYNISLQ